MRSKFQIVYAAEVGDPGKVHWLYHEEAEAMELAGISVDIKASPEATELMYRGFSMQNPENYPADPRFINRYPHHRDCLLLSCYYPHIADLSIETFFVDKLNDDVPAMIRDRGWQRAFIKKDSMALEHIEEGKSVWPNTSLEEMSRLYAEEKVDGVFAIRRYVEPGHFDQELRYWVFNGHIYQKENKVPLVVHQAAERLNRIGSRYYTIDATPEFVVEVNPGESSDRHAVNSAELFASWIKKEFAT